MIDQAARLRELASEIQLPGDISTLPEYNTQGRAKVIAVTSGKGGVGKTNTSVNLALKLREYGADVLLIDADLNLANADIMLGISPQFNITDAMIKGYPIKDVIMKAPGDIDFLGGGSGLVELLATSGHRTNTLLKELEYLEQKYDYIILDTPAGLSQDLISLLMPAHYIFVVTTPEPTSIADAYAVVKILNMQKKELVYILMNQVNSQEHGKELFGKFKMVVERFLTSKVKHLGSVEKDSKIQRAIMEQTPVSLSYPNATSVKAYEALAERIITRGKSDSSKKNYGFFRKLTNRAIFN